MTKFTKFILCAVLVFALGNAAYAVTFEGEEFILRGAGTVQSFENGAHTIPVLKSPNGTLYRLTVSNAGTIVAQAIQ